MDNGLLALKSENIPFLVDPEGQASKWLKLYYEKYHLVVVNSKSEPYMRKVEEALRIGGIIIVEDMDE